MAGAKSALPGERRPRLGQPVNPRRADAIFVGLIGLVALALSLGAVALVASNGFAGTSLLAAIVSGGAGGMLVYWLAGRESDAATASGVRSGMSKLALIGAAAAIPVLSLSAAVEIAVVSVLAGFLLGLFLVTVSRKRSLRRSP